MIGITLVRAVAGHEKSVYSGIKQLDRTRGVHHAFGEFDFLVILDVEDIGNFHEITDDLRKLDHVAQVQEVVAGRALPEIASLELIN